MGRQRELELVRTDPAAKPLAAGVFAREIEHAGETARLAAEARAKSGRTKDAEGIYRALLEDNPEDRETAAALIDLYENDDRLDDALELLGRLEKTDAENSAIPERITLDLARAGRFAEAEARARALAAKRPENRAIRRLLSQVLFEKGSSPEGEKILRSLVVEDPDDDDAMVPAVVGPNGLRILVSGGWGSASSQSIWLNSVHGEMVTRKIEWSWE